MRWLILSLLLVTKLYCKDLNLKPACPWYLKFIGLRHFPEHYKDANFKKIGSGAMGEVYIVQFNGTEKRVVRKYYAEWAHLTSDNPDTSEVSTPLFNIDTFFREAEVYEYLGEKKFDGMTKYYGMWRDEAGRKFFELEFIPGSTDYRNFLSFDTKIEAKKNIKNALLFYEKIIKQVEKLNKLGVTHYDLKPENILVTQSGEVKLIDFSSAEIRGVSPRLSSIGVTEGYYPPELAGSPHPSSDQYSLAKILINDVFVALKKTYEHDPASLKIIRKCEESLIAKITSRATAHTPSGTSMVSPPK
jgi:serine/threonine protein kinase